jgi:transcriptional regulator of acetoin/glycerol metabolism
VVSAPAPRPLAPPARRGLLTAEQGFYARVQAYRREILAQALLDSGGNVTHAATALGLARPYLHRLMRQFNLGRFQALRGVKL